MSLSIEIIPHAPSIDMYGEPDSSSAYSLSGHVSITLRPSFSLFEHSRTTAYLLHSLTLTFDGQTEVITPSFGYSGFRLCTVKEDVAPEEPVEITNDGQEDTTCVWNVTYSIPVPGWLPATTQYGASGIGTSYALSAEAHFMPLEDYSVAPSIFSLSTICAPFRVRTKTLHASLPIVINRFVDSHHLDTSEIPQALYLVNSKYATAVDKNRPHIPEGILTKIQVMASVPEFVDTAANGATFSMRLRSRGLSTEECQRLELTGFSIDLAQRERSRSQPTPESRRRLSLPPDSQQPPHVPLTRSHKLGFMYEGFYTPPEKQASHLREFSLLHTNVCGEYKLEGDCHIFKDDSGAENPAWYTVESTIPVCKTPKVSKDDEDSDYMGMPVLRSTSTSPMLTIRHEIRLMLSICYDDPQHGRIHEILSFNVPIKFASIPPPPPVTGPPIVVALRSEHLDAPACSALPAYSQLFHSNGDRKIDPTPLPLYTAQPVDEMPASPKI
ncbi:hypothetical protein CYLTODRAFT_412702 [Cylindrobasidium torrendii FP15055 ss-10]|uniref:Arrestin-like N-terminal domain-containing protein n=1 Tax=Cylindrobasidium torrendii FP15055 ss-10 TaxID=1314674 RepID=A0A0D7B6Y1_9AGAR|nr:hypothetical protein CYLTODRAFT_412702 [Cylindrobasidium torrendii FP15055 ss-10]